MSEIITTGLCSPCLGIIISGTGDCSRRRLSLEAYFEESRVVALMFLV